MKLSFYASDSPKAINALLELGKIYEQHDFEKSDIIVVLGGDGTMLRAMHDYAHLNTPLFGLNLGTLGFLLNEYKKGDLISRIKVAKPYDIHPLRMIAKDTEDKTYTELAYNEVSLLRETHSSAKLMVSVNGEVRLPLLVCDGVMVSTAVGSTAYNSSASGPILPLSANVLPITPISAFRPRRWSGALVPDTSIIRFDVITPQERPVSASADSTEIRDVCSVDIRVATDVTRTLLFDSENHLEERIYQEQFAP